MERGACGDLRSCCRPPLGAVTAEARAKGAEAREAAAVRAATGAGVLMGVCLRCQWKAIVSSSKRQISWLFEASDLAREKLLFLEGHRNSVGVLFKSIRRGGPCGG